MVECKTFKNEKELIRAEFKLDAEIEILKNDKDKKRLYVMKNIVYCLHLLEERKRLIGLTLPQKIQYASVKSMKKRFVKKTGVDFNE